VKGAINSTRWPAACGGEALPHGASCFARMAACMIFFSSSAPHVRLMSVLVSASADDLGTPPSIFLISFYSEVVTIKFPMVFTS
jgi:hypothetical protein